MKFCIAWNIDGAEIADVYDWDSRDMAQLHGILSQGPTVGEFAGRRCHVFYIREVPA